MLGNNTINVKTKYDKLLAYLGWEDGKCFIFILLRTAFLRCIPQLYYAEEPPECPMNHMPLTLCYSCKNANLFTQDILLDSSGVVLDVHSGLAIILLRKRMLVALLQLCCGCLCFVPFPHGALGWSVVFDCGIS